MRCLDLEGMMCDISEMYLRIELIAEDRPYHRFLWRDMKVDQKPSVYEFNRLVFGVNSSPFLAQLVSQHHARLHEKSYPRAAETILKSTGVSSFLASAVDWLSASPAALPVRPLSQPISTACLLRHYPLVKTSYRPLPPSGGGSTGRPSEYVSDALL